MSQDATRDPVATYRLQLRPEFDFRAASELAEYFASLGVSHLYASPYLQAAAGSSHGYDVVDPGQVNSELGGDSGRDTLCAALSKANLKQLLDIVPNHMAIRGGHNAWWWDVLENGPSSRYSSFFDVEWRAAQTERVLLPILGDQYGVEVEAGTIQLERDGSNFAVVYHEHRNPLAPRSIGHLLQEVASRLASSELAFVADALAELPAPNVVDWRSRARRHRDKAVLQDMLQRLCDDPSIAAAIDEHLLQVNGSPDALHEVLERQIYRLSFWRIGSHELDYRRFFDIDSLVGLRVEEREVFEATHDRVLKWLADRSVDGLRLDHIDGLYDPKQYLQRLARHAPQAWLLVEKILEEHEELPDWPVAGTTGYEFLNQAQWLLVDPDGEQPLTQQYCRLLDLEEPEDFDELVAECKRLVLQEALASDVRRLSARLADICQRHRRQRDYSRFDLESAIVELCVAFPVYRSYVTPSGIASSQDGKVQREACERARNANPQLDERLFAFLESLLLLESSGEEELEFVLRLQQLTGPAMAKGVEDTAFYRFNRLVALNEVGGNPARFSLDAESFHHLMQARQERTPHALNTTSTHDTKRSEDVRSRLLVLSEVPQLWELTLERWRSHLAGAKQANVLPGGSVAPDARTEYALWQNLVGAWPIERERMSAYMQKAVREAKLHSSWHSPNEAYEQAIDDYLEQLYAHDQLIAELQEFVESISEAAHANSLCQVVLKLMCPGVPDIYQGTELWDSSLVDPDNRRPVDFARRRELLESVRQLSAKTLWEARGNGAIKLFVITRGLGVRRRRAASFSQTGTYTPLTATGRQRERMVAFMRGRDTIAVITRWWMKHGDDFANTSLTLPDGKWRNVLCDSDELDGNVPISSLLGPLPVAILERCDP